MKIFLKQERGVTLISLAAVIIIMGIIISILVYNAKDASQVGELTNLYTDIENLSDKISAYYAKYGKVPALSNEVVNVDNITPISSWKADNKNPEYPIGENDTGLFLVIDLNALENLTLNYGKGFEKISTNGENEGITDNDIYVINENSHNIFYLKGITIEGKTYYTNQDKDSEKVNLRYVEGIKIPEGYTYKGKESGKITIVCDTDNTTYEWTNYDEGMDIDNQITFEGKNDLDNNQQTKDNFIESAKAYNGYYQSVQNEGTDEKKSVIYLSLSENAENAWSSVYEEEGIYIDENNHTAYIPKGFKVSKLPNMNNIKKGLVIEEENTKNQYVWIEVPKNITENAVTGVQIENALKEYANAFTESEYEDNWYDGCGITNENAYNELKQEMLQSIKLNGGFYIARFEAGTTGGARSSGSSASSFEEIRNQYGEPVSQKGKNLYNYLNVAQAQKLASNSNSGIVDEKSQPYKKSLMFGIQWDLVCKFIQETGTLSLSQIKIDSSKYGNYTETMEQTGQNAILNIFDFAGNVGELTLEKVKSKSQGVYRGGDNNNTVISNRAVVDSNVYDRENIGFRITLFK